MNNQSSHLDSLGVKKSKINPNANRRKEIIKRRAEIHEIENRKTRQRAIFFLKRWIKLQTSNKSNRKDTISGVKQILLQILQIYYIK